MNQIFCLHRYGKPITFARTRHMWGDEHMETTIHFYYQCEKCGKVKQGREMRNLEHYEANKFLK